MKKLILAAAFFTSASTLAADTVILFCWNDGRLPVVQLVKADNGGLTAMVTTETAQETFTSLIRPRYRFGAYPLTYYNEKFRLFREAGGTWTLNAPSLGLNDFTVLCDSIQPE